MDAKTLEALKASIAKWERNTVAERLDEYRTGPDDCALCDLFFGKGCSGCPVRARTGRSVCIDTPYVGATSARHRWLLGDQSGRNAAQMAAREEVEFLKSLLPAEEV